MDDCDVKFFLTVFSHIMIIKDFVQWKIIYGWKDFHLPRVSNQRSKHFRNKKVTAEIQEIKAGHFLQNWNSLVFTMRSCVQKEQMGWQTVKALIRFVWKPFDLRLPCFLYKLVI